MNDMQEASLSDCDVCDSDEIDSIFNSKCEAVADQQISDSYLMHMDGTLNTNPSIAVATSDGNIEILRLDSGKLARIESLPTTDYGLCVGVKFSTDNDNMLYSGHSRGLINLWDLRTPKKSVTQFKETAVIETDSQKTFTCLNLSSNNRLLASGTELHEGDAFIIFWDVRNEKLIGGYWESHTDDITKLEFHAEDPNKLLSTSTDGLLNVYDLSQNCEDDALLDTLNSESSIEQVRWFKQGKKDAIFCSTHTFDVQLWSLEDAEPYVEFKRNRLSNEIKRKSDDFSYVADAHFIKDSLLLLIGSNFIEGECLRGLSVGNNKSLIPKYEFRNNNQRVRSSWYNKYNDFMLTGGEKGILNLWKLDTFDL